ncbi:hypothetical protein GSI_10824 [Ganoderma sinense ZZ0214-1]|uniref:Uncharacterized protein n=1 Tax=Ganoderma sinense ZZ0214-1 TaxID=1077348 RepID=A0A2G8S1N1_9APHY|nr:hypothetical protein GSI_10824 [Ganoderma sinense ZZ0214-1]
MKRPRDMFDSPISSPPIPSKRRFLSQPMAPSSSPSTSRSTPYVLPRQPSCSPWALATPHDSPSNPFGLNRSLRALTLPRPSGFGKHIVLRLQLVSTADAPRTRGGPSRRHTEAPFRIVQLPLNFSFRLLHMLILFVFASDARLLMKRKRRVFSPPSPIGRKNKGKTRGKSGNKDKAEDDEEESNEEGHLFEVLNDISVCSMVGMRPGQIRPGTGKLYARLSSARERKLFNDPDDDDDEDDVFAGASANHTTPLAEAEKDVEEGWVWEAEDDFMLSNVWSDGLDLKKGIIYHHTPSTPVHITVNQTRVPGRKGTGNTPYVFVAQGGTDGAIRISNVASGPIPLSDDEKENNTAALRKKGKSKTRTAKGRGRGRDHMDDLPEEDLEEVSDLAEQETANDDQRERWNASDAFQRFLKREAKRERAMRRHPNPIAPPSPIPPSKSQRSARANNILVPPSSSPVPHGKLRSQTQSKPPYRYANASAASSAVSLAPSSPSTLPIIHPSDFDGDLSGWSDYLPEAGDEETEHQGPRYSIEIPLQTPFLAHPAARRRIDRVCLRLERQTSRGLSELSDSEDSEADVEDEEEGERGRRGERGARRGGSPSEDATARRAAVDSISNPNPLAPLVPVSAPTSALPPPPAPVLVPPVVAAEGPDVFVQGREDDSDHDEGGGDTEDDESAHEEGEQNSDDEGWEIGGVWGLGPVPLDWDSEEEV